MFMYFQCYAYSAYSTAISVVSADVDTTDTILLPPGVNRIGVFMCVLCVPFHCVDLCTVFV